MDYIGFALPILPGQAKAARAFQQELDGARRADYAVRERTIGISKELWFLQQTANGDLFVAYLECDDLPRALDAFAASRDPFDVWFKERLATVTGLDLNEPPSGPLSVLVSHYEASSRAVDI